MPRGLEIGEAKQKIYRFCALRERSPKEVTDKLRSWGLPEVDSKTVLENLISENFVNEQRFANAFCHDKFEFNSWGKQKIKAAIFQHQIDDSLVEVALLRIESKKYFERLMGLATKKWSKLANEELVKRKQKTLAFLVSKGFEADLIWQAINILSRK